MTAQRIIHRGADSIRFLGSYGGTFALPYGHSKKAMPTGWNLPGAGVGADKAIAHLARGNNVDLLAEFVTIGDIDFDFPEQVAKLGSLAHTAKVERTNAPDRGALLYRVVDGPVPSANWMPEGATEPHAELLAQTKTGNFKKKTIAGYHKGGEYCIVDAQFGIKEITRDELILIWAVITDTELYAEKSAELPKARPTARKPIDSHDDLMAQVKAYWSTLAVFEHHGMARGGTEDEYGGATRILGHGGLIVQRDGLWYNHSAQVGGDAIDAWAYCIRRDRDRYFLEIIEEMAAAAGIAVPRPAPPPLPAGAEVRAGGHIILKTTPTPAPTPRPAPPALTPSVVEKLANVLRGPDAIAIINRLGRIRDREGWRTFLIQLVTQVAPSQKGWVFDAGQAWLGEQFGKSGEAARKKLYRMDAASLIHYLHTGKKEEGKAGRAKMRIDLQPLIAELWESCAKLENIVNPNTEFSNLNDDPPTNVYAVYTGVGQFADASMRTLYKYAVARMGIPTVLARSLTASALTSLDYLSRAGEATRAELVAESGMSPGSAAGGTRVLEQLAIVTVEWEGPGTPKIYVLRPDWEAHLQYMIQHMASYGARIRLVIRNYDRWIAAIERTLKTTFAPQMIHGLKERKRQLERTRKKWCIHGNKLGAYGRYAQGAA